MLASANKKSSGRIKSFPACPEALNLLWLSWPLWLSKLSYIFPESNRILNIKNLFKGDFSNLSYQYGGCQDCL